MRFGACIGIGDCYAAGDGCNGESRLSRLAALGFDYAELPLAAVAALPEEEFERLKDVFNRGALKSEAFNVFLPGDLRITGEGVDPERLRDYGRRGAARARALGGEVIVLGSAGARNLPGGWTRERGCEQLREALAVLSDAVQPYEVTIALEPLNRRESNIVNSVAEALEVVKAVNRPNVRVLADYYHMAVEEEAAEVLAVAAGMLAHVHFANPYGRVYPVTYKSSYNSFFENLRAAGYDRRVSLECATADFERDAPVALNVLRRGLDHEEYYARRRRG